MLPLDLKPKHEYDLIRLGGDFDGGYLVERNSIDKSTVRLIEALGEFGSDQSVDFLIHLII